MVLAIAPYLSFSLTFDKDITIFHPSGKKTAGYIDFYKADHFLIEAKQGSEKSGKGTAKRGTNSYLKAMEAAFVQAIAYTRNLPNKPPFLLTCDIGDHFELWMGFSGDYGGYGARQDIALTALRKPEIFDLFVDIFTDPQKRNPEKIAAKVTREVAADLAELSKRLEGVHEPEEVAHFLMCCIFTMFAEDVGLLKEHLFTDALETRWLTHPKSFKPEVEALWQAMNDGTSFGFYGRLLRFNGGLFADARAFELTLDQLRVLLTAAKREWKDVEPAIFGTLLERALDSKERSKLGAHYTPRSYVERLVRPVVMEPLREQWDLVQGEVKQILGDVEKEPTATQKKKAVAALEGFLTELRQVRILDPACGSGNFLYVTLDLIKQLESEVFQRLADVTGAKQTVLDIVQVNPSQFLGIEINPRAAAIADLVIWIGYLQWHFRQFGDIPPMEPVLREYKNIECRDAVLAYDGKEEDVDPKTGKVRTRWGGRKMKHPVTGEMVPDPSDQIPIYRYINPRPAKWQEADYVVSNPPFIGNAWIRERLGDGYAETLRKVYKDVPDTVDYVMYWWHKAAELTRAKRIQRFGFITTSSISQIRLRGVIDFYLNHQDSPLKLVFVIPDHPWTEEGAAVRIAMTSVELNNAAKPARSSKIGIVASEQEGTTPEDAADRIIVKLQSVQKIFSNLKSGVDVTKTFALLSNSKLSSQGFVVGGAGFVINSSICHKLESEAIHPFITGTYFAQTSEEKFSIDVNHVNSSLDVAVFEAYGWEDLISPSPLTPLPEGEGNRNLDWLPSPSGRRAGDEGISKLAGRTRQIPSELLQRAKELRQQQTPAEKLLWECLRDHRLYNTKFRRQHNLGQFIADFYCHAARLVIELDGKIHQQPQQQQRDSDRDQWMQANGFTVLRFRNEDVFSNTEAVLETIAQALPSPLAPLAEAEENKRADRLPSPLGRRAGDEGKSTEHESIDEIILERLVALNAERAEEERNGLIRWLRPEYQAPDEVHIQPVIEGIAEVQEETAIAPVEQQKFPKAFKDQLAAVRDLLRNQGGEWTVEQIAAQFKGASRQKQTILTCLESLEALGIIAKHEEGSDSASRDAVVRWYLAELQKAS